jgi:hypothetical protein
MSKLPMTLTQLQSVCKKIEEGMMEFLLQYIPCESMTVGDVKIIARTASRLAFSTFDAAATEATRKSNEQ